MADIYDVENALVELAQSAIYPNGINNPSIVNCDVRIFPGWPDGDTLDADLTARKVQISVFPSNIARATTRFDTQWQTISVNTTTITLTTNTTNNTITVTGTISVPQTCMAVVNGIGYAYSIQATDTLNSIATNLAALIPHASAIGNVITINYVYSLSALMSVAGNSSRELAREKRLFIITIWAPTPQIRYQLGNAIAELFSSTYRISLSDGFYGQLSFGGSREQDILEVVKCYVRDLNYIVEYAITQNSTFYTIANNIININQAAQIQAIVFTLLSGGDFLLLSGGNFNLLE